MYHFLWLQGYYYWQKRSSLTWRVRPWPRSVCPATIVRRGGPLPVTTPKTQCDWSSLDTGTEAHLSSQGHPATHHRNAPWCPPHSRLHDGQPLKLHNQFFRHRLANRITLSPPTCMICGSPGHRGGHILVRNHGRTLVRTLVRTLSRSDHGNGVNC